MARYYRSTPQEFVSQYVPENLALQQGYFDNLQKKQDEYTAQIAGLDKPFNFITTQEETQSANKTKKEVQDKMKELEDLNFNDPTARKKAIETIKGVRDMYSPTGQIGAYEANYAKFIDYNKQLDELGKKAPKEGGKPSDEIKKLKQIALETFKQTGQVTANGYNQFSGITPAPFSDVTDQADKLGDKWKADSIERGGYYDTEGRFIKKSKQQIEATDPREIYQHILPQLKSDPMNQAYVRQKVMLDTYGREVADEDKDKMYESVFHNAASFAAAKYGYKKTSTDEDWQEGYLYKHQAGKKDDLQDELLTTSSQSEALPGSLIKIPDEISKLEFNADGSVKPLQTMEKQIIGKAGTNLNTPSGNAAIYKARQFDMEANKKVAETIVKLQKEHPELSGLTPQKTIEAYKNAIKSLESESVPLEHMGNVAAKNIGEGLSRNKTQRNFYIYDGKEKTSDGQLSTVLDKLGIKEEDFDTALKSGIGGYTQAGPSAGSYYLEVPDKNGTKRRVMISPDAEMGRMFSASQKVNEARKSLSKKEVQPFEDMPNYNILVKPTITRDGNTKWEYMEVVKDENGQVISSNPTTLDDIRATEREHLKNSKYLASQLGVLKPHTTE